MGALMGTSRYVAAIIVVFVIFNLYFFQSAFRPHSDYYETSPPVQNPNPNPNKNNNNNSPAAPLTSVKSTTTAEAVTVTVTATATTTATVSPDTSNVKTPSSTSFPAKIWQKCGHKGINEQSQGYIDGWLKLNPHLRHEVLTDDSADQYVLDNYASSWPEAYELYQSLTVPILKADFLRMLILYADGGIWNDLDVECLAPITDWIPKSLLDNTKTKPINVVVGIEFNAWQFASWTVMAKPRLNHFRVAIEYIMGELRKIAEQNHVEISGITKTMCDDVVKITGPQAMTVALLKSVSDETRLDFTKQQLDQLKEPKLLGDILVLPQAAFAGLQGGHPKDQGPELVSHHYFGSWKNDEGGEDGKPNSHG